jgi:hypothetical protein
MPGGLFMDQRASWMCLSKLNQMGNGGWVHASTQQLIGEHNPTITRMIFFWSKNREIGNCLHCVGIPKWTELTSIVWGRVELKHPVYYVSSRIVLKTQILPKYIFITEPDKYDKPSIYGPRAFESDW